MMIHNCCADTSIPGVFRRPSLHEGFFDLNEQQDGLLLLKLEFQLADKDYTYSTSRKLMEDMS